MPASGSPSRGLLHAMLVTGEVESADAAMTAFVDLLLCPARSERSPEGGQALGAPTR